MDVKRQSLQNSRNSIIKILDLEENLLLLQHDLSEEQVKKMNADLNCYYRNFIKSQKQLIQINESMCEWSYIMDIGEKIKNKVIYMQTKLNKVLDDKSDQNNLIDVTEDLNSLLKNQKCIIDESVEHDPYDYQTKILTNFLISLYRLFTTNQLKFPKCVNSAELTIQLAISKSILKKAMVLLEKLKKSHRTDDLSEPARQFNDEIYSHKLVKIQRFLISQIELFEKEKFYIAAEAVSLSDHLTQINRSFLSTQTKIETLVCGTDVQYRQLKIGKKIRQKANLLQDRLDETSKSLNDSKTAGNQVEQAFIKLRQALKLLPANTPCSEIKRIVATEPAAIFNPVAQIFD